MSSFILPDSWGNDTLSLFPRKRWLRKLREAKQLPTVIQRMAELGFEPFFYLIRLPPWKIRNRESLSAAASDIM